MNTIICFYHAPCNDGAASAAALRLRLELAVYRDRQYEIVSLRFISSTSVSRTSSVGSCLPIWLRSIGWDHNGQG
jgi:hypothetical protein